MVKSKVRSRKLKKLEQMKELGKMLFGRPAYDMTTGDRRFIVRQVFLSFGMKRFSDN